MWEGHAMVQNKFRRFCVGFVCAVLALSVAGCGCSSKDAEGNAGKGSASQEESEAARFSDFENDYLRMGVAQGWDADPEGDADQHRRDDKGGYHALTIEHGDRLSLSSYGYLRAAVYDVETVEGAGEIPEEKEYLENIVEIDPIEIADTRMVGYSAEGKTASGDATYQYQCYSGTLNGHYVEVSFIDYSGGSLIEGGDMSAMAQSLEVK